MAVRVRRWATVRLGLDRLEEGLFNYPTNAKAFDISAGWAHSTVEEFVKNFEDSEGLSGALKEASGTPRTLEEKTQEEEEPDES